MKTLDQYIKVFDNVLSADVCDSVLREYGSTNEWVHTAIDKNGVDKSVRNVMAIPMSSSDVINRHREVRSALDAEIFTAAGKVVDGYSNFTPCPIQGDSGYDLLRYEEGGFYSTHIDSSTGLLRTLSCSFMLNDDYEGGEWEFFNGALKMKPPRGSAIAFPSNFLYPHGIAPVTKGTRFSIVTWFA
jgi:predicted 2-oxoglutarate/Fe(II)-dependent dioxygenase YbiX